MCAEDDSVNISLLFELTPIHLIISKDIPLRPILSQKVFDNIYDLARLLKKVLPNSLFGLVSH